jgi:hypothetical protein
VDTLKQSYVFLPALMKEVYCAFVLKQFPGSSAILFTARKKCDLDLSYLSLAK